MESGDEESSRETLNRLILEYVHKAAVVCERASDDFDSYAHGIHGIAAAAKCIRSAEQFAGLVDDDDRNLAMFTLGSACYEIEVAYQASKPTASLVEARRKRVQKSIAIGSASAKLTPDQRHEVRQLFAEAKRDRLTDSAAFVRILARLRAQYGLEVHTSTVRRAVKAKRKG